MFFSFFSFHGLFFHFTLFHLPELQSISFFKNQIVRLPKEYQDAICVVNPLPVRSLANLAPNQQIEALQYYNSSLPPSVRGLWERWKDSAEIQRLDTSHPGVGHPRNEDVREIMHELMTQVDHLYAEQWEDLVARVIQSPDTHLSPWEIERIVWEAIPTERKWLEAYLPANHPLILKFATEYSVPLKNNKNFSILL